MENFHAPFSFEKMSMNLMEKGVVLLVCVLLIGLVGAEDGWGEFTDGGGDADTGGTETTIENESSQDSESIADSNVRAGETADDDGEIPKFTRDFYIAIGIGAGTLFLILLLLFLLKRKPKNRWKKKE